VGTLTGYVVSARNLSAIAGAQVSCMAAFPMTAMTNFANATTSSTGYFNFMNTSAGNYTCYATAAGYFPGSVSVNFHAGSANFSVRIVLGPLVGSISGELRDARTGGYLRVVNVSCDTPFTAAGGITTSNLHKFASDTYFFEELAAATYTCTAGKPGWFPSTQTVVVSPANNTVANFYLTQRPTYASGYLLDIRTLDTLSPGAIYCRSFPGNESFNYNVNANGFYNVSVTLGYTYLCEGSSPDYLNKTFTLDCPYFKNVTLTPLNCTVNVITVDKSTGARLGNVSLDFRSPSITNLNTDSNGFAQVRTKAFLYSYVVGSKVGYSGDSAIIYCNRSGVANITLYLTPVPNRLTVLVLDERTNKPIVTATVFVQGGNFTARPVNGTGYVEYFPIAAGNYVALASAPGYSSNSTPVPPLTYGSDVFVVIYLKEQPCTVIITVYDTGANNSVLSGATVFLLPSGQSFTSDNSGRIPTQNLLADAITGYNASKSGYTTDSGVVNCARNRTVNINIYLTPLPNTITVLVLDADTLQPLPAYISLQATPSSVFSSVVKAGSSGSYRWTPVPASEYYAYASYEGYADNNTYVGVTTRNTTLFATIYLRIKPCVVTVLVTDGTDNTTFPPLDQALVVLSNEVQQTTNTTGTVVFYLNPNTTANAVYGYKFGYDYDYDNFTCSPGANIQIVLVLYPLPNTLTVLVRDAQTFALIPGASVTLLPTNAMQTAVSGQTVYTPLAAGTYSARASASGYSTNTSETSATLTRNTNATLTVWLRTLDCVLNVLVEDETNGFAPLADASVFINTSPAVTSLTTPASGIVSFNLPYNTPASIIVGYKDGYDGDNDTFTCGRGVVVNRTLTLRALPNALTVLVRDAQTFALISGATVTLLPTGTVRTATAGQLYYSPLAAGTYFANATANGYGTNTSETATLLRNDNKTVTVWLRTRDCVLNVLVQDGTNPSNPTPLDAATVSLNNTPSSGTQTTTASGTLTFNLAYNDNGTTVSGSKTGYSSATGSYTCSRGAVLNVTLVLVPLPNSLTVLVRDAQTFALIPNATVTLLQTQAVRTATAGSTLFSPLAAGTYQANGTAAGYSTNTSETATLLRNDNKTVTVWLTQLSCTLFVQVINSATNAQISGATVTLNNPSYPVSTTNPTSTFTIFAINPATSVSGSATGYRGNDTKTFNCAPGTTVNVTLVLNPVLFVTLIVENSYPAAVNKAVPSANVTLNGTRTLVATSANTSTYVYEVSDFPYTGVYDVVAAGFVSFLNRQLTFTNATRTRTISITPVNYDINFIIYETLSNNTNVVIGSNDTASNNILDFAADLQFPLSQGYYKPVGYLFQGGVSRYSNTSGLSSQNFVDSTYNSSFPLSLQATFQPLLSSFLQGSTGVWASSSTPQNVKVRAAPFQSIAPSIYGRFYAVPNNLTGFVVNFGNLVTGASFVVNVPDFPDTPVRQLVVPLPYRRAFGFINIQFVPYEKDATTISTFTKDEYAAVIFNTSTTSDRLEVAETGKLTGFKFALLETGLEFGSVVRSLEVNIQSEFFDTAKSGYFNPATNSLALGLNPVVPGLTQFVFPPQTLLSALFTPNPTTGQSLRNPNARLFYLLQYRMIRKA